MLNEMDWGFIFIDYKKYSNVIDYVSKGFSVEGVESFMTGPDEHLIGPIKIVFYSTYFEIVYEKKNLVLALMTLYVRLSDECLTIEKITINDKKIYYSTVESLINKNIDVFYNSTSIRIYVDDDNLIYSRNFLTFLIDPKLNSNYFLYKELNRWEK